MKFRTDYHWFNTAKQGYIEKCLLLTGERILSFLDHFRSPPLSEESLRALDPAQDWQTASSSRQVA
jgi:hypothetical protein